jgi:hypothetical protein
LSDPAFPETAAGVPAPIARCRPFNLGDLMVLMAAVACGLALSQSTALILGQMLGMLLSLSEGGPRRLADPVLYVTNVKSLVTLAMIVLVQFFLPWLAAFLVIRLRRPRPELRDVVRQPGTAAVLVLGGWIVVSLPIAMVCDARILPVFQLLFVASVPTAWLVLRWTGHWRSEPGWIDRFGCCLGIFYCLASAGLFVATSLS